MPHRAKIGKPNPRPKLNRATEDRDRAEKKLEEGLEETFPGSDPVAVTEPTIIDKGK